MSEGVIATSYAAGDKFFIDPAKLLPLERFLPQPKGAATRGGRGAPLRGGQTRAVKLKHLAPFTVDKTRCTDHSPAAGTDMLTAHHMGAVK